MRNKKVMSTHRLEYIINLDKPLGVNEFSNALKSINSEYQIFISENYDGFPPKTELHIEQISNCCIRVEFIEVIALAYSSLPFIEHSNTLFDFAKHLKESFDFLLGKNRTDKKLSNKQLNNLEDIVAPVINTGNSATINFTINNTIGLNSLEADELLGRAIRDKVKELKSEVRYLEQAEFKNVILVFDNIKGDINKKGHKGIISSISDASRSLIWVDNNDKETMLKSNFNPLNSMYLVDVEIEQPKQDVFIYKIIKLHSAEPLD